MRIPQCLKRYTRSPTCSLPSFFLWWFGGAITCGWAYFLALAAYEKTFYSDAPTFDHFVMYMTALTFCVGVRGVEKAGISGDSPSDAPADRLHGEIWYVVILALTGTILHDHFSPAPLWGHVKNIPEQLFWTNVGTASLFTGAKVFKVWHAIKKFADGITKVLA